MHEVSLVAAWVEQIGELAQKEGFDRVLAVRVKVGALSGVDPSCIEFCFPEVTRNSVLEGSKLILEYVGVELYCDLCHKISFPEDPSAIFCIYCHSGEVVIRQGKEFKVIDLDVL